MRVRLRACGLGGQTASFQPDTQLHDSVTFAKHFPQIVDAAPGMHTRAAPCLPAHDRYTPLPFCPWASLERVGQIRQGDVSILAGGGLHTSLTALTVLLASPGPPAFDQHHLQQQHGAGLQLPLLPPGAWQTAEAAAQAGIWQPLLALSALQEVVLGAVHASQQAAFTCSINLHERQHTADNGTSRHSSSSSLACRSSGAGCRFNLHEGAGVSAYICPTESWAELAGVQVRCQRRSNLGHDGKEAARGRSGTLSACLNLLRQPAQRAHPAYTKTQQADSS